jgi:D-inositol-3-phosphate glycosyltransferase
VRYRIPRSRHCCVLRTCGVPVVASAVGGLTDTVVPDVTGRLVAPNKPRECAEAILPILKQPFTRRSLGAAGHDRARSRYSWDRIAFDTDRVYRQLVADALQDVRRAPIGDTATHATNAAC